MSTNRATRYWWDAATEPHYGAYGSVLGNDGYIYGFGGGHSDYISLARVPQAYFFDLTQYEYWNGTAYTPERVYSSDSDAGVFQSGGQSSVIWSPHFNGYLRLEMSKNEHLKWAVEVTCSSSADHHITDLGFLQAYLAPRPEGPWSGSNLNLFHDPVGCADGECSYTPVAQPWWDESGKTLVVTYTQAGDYALKVINIVRCHTHSTFVPAS